MIKPNHRICLDAAPAWLPKRLAQCLTPALGQPPYRFSFSATERLVMRKRDYLPPSQWAAKYRMVRLSSLPGLWKNIFTPYLAGIMDAARFPGVEVLILCKTPQTGGSEAGLNILAHMIDLSPGPAMVVFPDENTAKENAVDRILPMIKDSRRLRGYLSGSVTESSSIRINLKHMPIYLAWSGSASRLGNKPVRILILDELDKYQNPRREATSENLAEKRTTTWKSRRFIFKLSTPTTLNGPIWTAYTEEAHAHFIYQVVCPHCGSVQTMVFDQIRWPENEREPENVLAALLAWYECPHCLAHWDDADRDRAVRKGFWQERDSHLELFAHLHQHQPVKIGFHLPAWLSYFVSLSEVAHAFLKYKKSEKLEDLKNFMNQYKAEPWVEEHATRSEDAILALCDDRPRGAVPGPLSASMPDSTGEKERVAVLLAGVDTHKSHFKYIIRAFGFGDTEESWLIQSGVAPSFSALNDILWNSIYTDGQGHEHKVRACMIDAMGGRTKEVYAWALKNRGRVFPWQGVRSLSQPYTPAPQEYFPDAKGNKVKIPGGLNLWRCDTTFFKSDLAHKLTIAPDDPGAFHLHNNASNILEQYGKEMCAEIWDDEKLGWENPQGKDNHFWDCEVMSLALAYILNVRHWAREIAEKKAKNVVMRPSTVPNGRSLKWR